MTAVTVDLYAAPVPWLGALAEHLWFVVTRDHQQDRWEVWQRANAGSVSWAHLHCNLLAPYADVGGGASRWLHRWQGGSAVALAARLEDAPQSYPNCESYLVWPGPNSNTFVQWVLAEDAYALPVTAIGKDHLGWFVLRRSHGGWQMYTPLGGFKWTAHGRLEMHLLTLVFGWDARTRRVLLPGVREQQTRR